MPTFPNIKRLLPLRNRFGCVRLRSAFAGSLALLSSLGLCGCAYQYIDEHGARHAIGLNHVVTQASAAGTSEVVMQQVTTLGVAVLRVPEQQGFSIGYTRNFSVNVYEENIAGAVDIDLSDPADLSYRDTSMILKDGL